MKVPDAPTIVGQLADPDRRRVFAAVVLGAATLDEVVARTGLDPAVAAKALGRLVDAGIVVRGSDGGLQLLDAAFREAARAALARPTSAEHEGAPPESAKVLRAFVRDGRLLQIPASVPKRRVILDWLAQDFEPGRRYSETMVNLVLGQRHADTAALRRHLVDEGFLDRAGGVYWRSGGTVSVTED
jgi:hypothetical protein